MQTSYCTQLFHKLPLGTHNPAPKKLCKLIKYSSIYCKMDCKVLMDGYEVFRSWMIEHTGLDIDHYIPPTVPACSTNFHWVPIPLPQKVLQTSYCTQLFHNFPLGTHTPAPKKLYKPPTVPTRSTDLFYEPSWAWAWV